MSKNGMPDILKMFEEKRDPDTRWPEMRVLTHLSTSPDPDLTGSVALQNRYLLYVALVTESRCNQVQWDHSERELAYKRIQHALFREPIAILHDAMAAAGDPNTCRELIAMAIKSMTLNVGSREN